MVLTLANDVWRCVRSEWCWDLTKTRVFQCFLSAERIGEALAAKTSSIVVTRCYVGRFASAGDRLHPIENPIVVEISISQRTIVGDRAAIVETVRTNNVHGEVASSG